VAKDERLYARFDIAMDEHPKIALLTDAAFRALFEMTLYSRRQLTDGFIAGRIALRRWGHDALHELCANDPERPSLFTTVKGGVDGFQIHDYEKHQTTTADIEAKREAGRKGGLAKASNRVAPASDSLEQKATAPLAITETETKTKTPPSKEGGGAKRATRIPDQFIVNQAMRDWAAKTTPGVNVDNSTAKFVDHWRAKSGRDAAKLDWVATWRNWLRSDYDRVPEGQRRVVKPPKLNGVCDHRFVGGFCAECSERET
jgi:hypothetical protein